MHVALLQLASNGVDRERNLADGLEACRQASAAGADLALLPEMWSIGYTFPNQSLGHASEATTPEQFASMAESASGPWVQAFRDLAVELGMAIAVGYLEGTPSGSRNTVSLFDRHGDEVIRYSKVHLCTFGSEGNLEGGTDFPVAELDLGHDTVRVGALICYDREFPEAARLLMLQGAELVIVPNACEIELNRLAQLQTRAFENMCAMAMTNYAEPDQNGLSVVFDGIAVDPSGAMRDMTVATGGHSEELVLAEVDLDRLREYRAREVWGPNHRHPGLYEPIARCFER